MAWVGEIEPVVQKLASSVGMNYRVVGKPKSPVLVTIDVKDIPLLEVFRNLGMQAGTLADIIYRPNENVVEVVYANRQ